jgi:hypothetical protein
MKLRLIDTSDEEMQEPLLESPSLGLDRAEPAIVADWATPIMQIETWQSNQLELSRLEQLAALIPNTREENRQVISWNFGDQEIEVDLSLVLTLLGRDMLMLGKNKQFALVLE